MTAYTFLWNNSTWSSRAKDSLSGRNLEIDYIAGDARSPFTEFSAGDEVFVISVIRGYLYLGGRLIAESPPVEREQAKELLGRNDLVDKQLFVIGRKKFLHRFRCGKQVRMEDARALELITSKGSSKAPDLDKNTLIDKQAFRSPYKLSPRSASILRGYLDLPQEVGINEQGDQSVDPLIPMVSSAVASSALDANETQGNYSYKPMSLANANLTIAAEFEALLKDVKDASVQLENEYINSPGHDIDAIVKRRIGQGSFRNLLEKQWGVQCWLSGLANRELLIASHIVPWSLSDANQKTDQENGLLLSVTWDTLFDKGLVSFSDEGIPLFHEILDEDTAKCLGISMNVELPGGMMTPVRKKNLRWHRERYGFGV